MSAKTPTMFGPYPGRIVEAPLYTNGWHDGDTCLVDLDLGFAFYLNALDWDGHRRISCRIFGINAPELKDPGGNEAADFARSLAPAGTRVTVISHDWDKYGGRFDGQITLPDGRDFASVMIASGHAVAYVP